MRLRPADEEDLSALADLERQLFGRDAWSAQALGEELAQSAESRSILVADAGRADGREVVGYAVLSCVAGTADLHRLGVRPDQQRRGIGRALVEALLGQARDRGCTEMLLEVDTGNDAAIGCYERFGFVELTRRPGYYHGGRRDALVMRCVLAPPGSVP